MKKEVIIIHSFALLHASLALGCRLAGILDDMVLTLLTMLMVVLLCWRRGVGVKFLVVCIVLVNVLGFAIGMGCARLFALFFSEPLLIHPLSTFITTEILGWAVYMGSEKTAQRNADTPEPVSVQWILVAFVTILSTRLAVILFSPGGIEMENTVTNIIVDYVFSCLAFVLLAIYAIRKNRESLEKQNLAKFRYMKLKQQVNPHFLFNSLNILDCLVCENQTEQASTYIHKLAGIYRYMLKSEEERTVKLRDELGFVEQYVELLKVRFPEGLQVTVEVREDALQKQAVPCSLQLLIENAIKHNAVVPSDPLRVRVAVEGDMILVENTLHPKKTESSTGTGLGLKYIRQEYEALAGKSIELTEDDRHFTVKLPLI